MCLRCRSVSRFHDVLPEHRIIFTTGVDDVEGFFKTLGSVLHIPAHMDRALALVGLACGVNERDLFDRFGLAFSCTSFLFVDDALAQFVVISSLRQLDSLCLVVRYDFDMGGCIDF